MKDRGQTARESELVGLLFGRVFNRLAACFESSNTFRQECCQLQSLEPLLVVPDDAAFTNLLRRIVTTRGLLYLNATTIACPGFGDAATGLELRHPSIPHRLS